MPKQILIALLCAVLFLQCSDKKSERVDTAPDTYYKEPYRPQFHFSPEEKWMNDPNGLVYHKNTYHMFYQYYPDSTVWGPMHWGHATSKDLVKWKHEPIALKPDSLGYIFSGSAVVDYNNTSKLGTEENPPMIAIFTYHDPEGEKADRMDFQTQGIAYSLDEGKTWKKYKGNPVIKNPGIRDFRDPKVFWHEDSNQWIMVVVAGNHAKFYRSPNLKDWTLSGEFGQEFGAHGGVWECPDLFKLPVSESGEERWVLLISINPGAPNGGSGTQYFIGTFDGSKFTPEHLDIRWLDYGTDNYAGITFNHAPQGERVFIGWMSNWNYAQVVPTEKWRSAMTVPRQLSLYRDGPEIKLKNYPVPNFSNLYSSEEVSVPDTYDDPILLKTTSRRGADITFNADLSKPLQLRLSDRAGESLLFTANPGQKILSIDRSKAGKTEFHETFSQKQTQPYVPTETWVEVRILIDASSVEIFIDNGKYVFTTLVFPRQIFSVLNIDTIGNEAVRDLEINLVNSIWK